MRVDAREPAAAAAPVEDAPDAGSVDDVVDEPVPVRARPYKPEYRSSTRAERGRAAAPVGVADAAVDEPVRRGDVSGAADDVAAAAAVVAADGVGAVVSGRDGTRDSGVEPVRVAGRASARDAAAATAALVALDAGGDVGVAAACCSAAEYDCARASRGSGVSSSAMRSA